MFRHVLCAILLITSARAFAEPGNNYFYTGIQVGQYDEQGLDDSLRPKVILARLGHTYNRHLAIETQVGIGFDGGRGTFFSFGEQDVELKVDYLLGVYLKPIAPLSDSWSVHGLAGFSMLKLTARALGEKVTENENGFSYGAGITWNFHESVNLSLEYMSYLKEDDYDYSSINLGFGFSF